MLTQNHLTVSGWADRYRFLSSESSSMPGQWRTETAPYQREILDAVKDSAIEKIVIMSGSQLGKTEILLNTIGFHIDQDPAPILLIQPSEVVAKDFSVERLAPMIRDSAVLKSKVEDLHTRHSRTTILRKSFPGGYLALAGANAPLSVTSRPIRILLADEIDRFPVTAAEDVLALGKKRTKTFCNRKIILVSTPTNQGISRIEAEFDLSTQERWNLPCPSCNKYQPLRWMQVHVDAVSHTCKFCYALHNEHEWKARTGKWVADKPGAKVRGFHMNELISPWRTWKDIVMDFHEAKRGDLEAMRVWVNTTLGETWDTRI